MKGSALLLLLATMLINVKAFGPLPDIPWPQPDNKPTKKTATVSPWLVPSQVVSSRFPSSCLLASLSVDSTENVESQSSNNPSTASSVAPVLPPGSKDSRRSRRRKRPLKKKKATSAEAKNRSLYEQFPTSGNLPDPWYRAIPLEHLRRHPRFQPLPRSVKQLRSLQDVALFRQESWQWDALHAGRCTTSQAAAALGFLDPTPAQVLNVPNSWRKGAHRAYQRLSQRPVLRTLEDMRRVLLPAHTESNQDNEAAGSNNIALTDSEHDDDDPTEQDLWVETGEVFGNAVPSAAASTNVSSLSFVSEYLYEPTQNEFQQRRKYIKERSGGDYLASGIRLIWGNTQEATAVLTALNFFAQNDSQVVLKEIGMCGAELALNQSTSGSSSLLVGATPDAVICHGDGSLEVLEVKNHCPFFSNKNRKRKGGKLKAFSVGDWPLRDVGVMSQYVPQLQLEMYCMGPACQSAVMVRQTATHGAVLLRMKRDDAWIDEMLHFLHCFQREYVEARKSPRPDFFWHGSEASRYRRFVHDTIRVRDSVKEIARLDNAGIQRGSARAPFFLD